MNIGLVLQPFSEENLRLAAQLGATDIVCNMPDGDFSKLALLRSRVDLVLIDKITGQHILNTEHPEQKNEIEWLASVQVDPQYLVFSKSAPDYEKKLKDFNNGLKAITDDGTLANIMESHGF